MVTTTVRDLGDYMELFASFTTSLHLCYWRAVYENAFRAHVQHLSHNDSRDFVAKLLHNSIVGLPQSDHDQRTSAELTEFTACTAVCGHGTQKNPLIARRNASM